jgi:putative transposase
VLPENQSSRHGKSGRRDGSRIKKGQYSDEKIVQILKEAADTDSVPEVCRKYGVSPSTFTRWRARFAGFEVSDVARLRQLESENTRLQCIVAKQALEIDGLKEVVSKEW